MFNILLRLTGWVTQSLAAIPGKEGVVPLLDMILQHIPAPNAKATLDAPFAMCVNTIATDNHLGRIVTGKVEAGVVKLNDKLRVMTRDGKDVVSSTAFKATKLFYLEGLKRVDVEEARAGEIISLAGTDGNVTDTVCSPENSQPIPTIPISPPVISMTFSVNDSPLNGKEGNKLTSSMIKDRLRKEIENNVTISLRDASDPEAMDVQGRGELQIGKHIYYTLSVNMGMYAYYIHCNRYFGWNDATGRLRADRVPAQGAGRDGRGRGESRAVRGGHRGHRPRVAGLGNRQYERP